LVTSKKVVRQELVFEVGEAWAMGPRSFLQETENDNGCGVKKRRKRGSVLTV